MWEEGVRIYGTPELPNNFPISADYRIIQKEKEKKEANFTF